MIAFGADIGFRRVSIAATDGKRFEVRSGAIPSSDEISQAETFLGLFQMAQRIGFELVESFGSPDSILVEKPGAAIKVADEMHYSFALVSAALEGLGHGVVGGIMPASWKANALGRGNGHAKKPQILEWARLHGYEGTSFDESDAIGIAKAALMLTSIQTFPGME